MIPNIQYGIYAFMHTNNLSTNIDVTYHLTIAHYYSSTMIFVMENLEIEEAKQYQYLADKKHNLGGIGISVVRILSKLHIFLHAGPPTLQPLNTTYYGITDNMFTLSCAATNDPQSPNKITFEWFKDGIKQNDSTGIKSKMLDVSTSQLVIDELSPDQHSGNYSCGVYNNQSSNIVYTNTTVIIES